MNSKALVVALLLLAGLAAWWFVRSDTEIAPGGGPGTSKAAPSPAPVEAAKAVTGDLHAATATNDSQRTAAAVLPETGKAARSAAIRGRLVDANGAPRAGVEMSARSWATTEALDLGDLPVPATRPGAAPWPRLVTKPDGTFAWTLPPDHFGQLELESDDLVFAGEPPRVDGRKGDQDLGEVVAIRSGSLQGVVRDEHGRPAPGVKVSASLGVFAFGGGSMSETDASGAFVIGKLRAGSWLLRTASSKFQPTTEEIALKAEERRVDLVLVVKPGQAIAGQVKDDVGMPVAGCKVASKRREARGGVDIERFTTDEAAVTDAGGYFTLSGLAGETATVRAMHKGHVNAVAKDVRVGTGDLVLTMNRVAEVRGVLVGADGAPIAGSEVTADAVSAPAPANDSGPDLDALDFARGNRARTAADGSFQLTDVKPGTMRVLADGNGHRPVRSPNLEVKPGQVVEGVRLVAPTGASAKVTVVDEAGKPVVGAKVRVKTPEARDEGGNRVTVRARRVEAIDQDDVTGGVASILGPRDELGSAITDESGIAIVKGLPAGDAVAIATHDQHADAEPARLTLPGAGTIEAKLTMRTPGFAEVHVVSRDGKPVAECAFAVRAEAEGGGTKNGTTDANGAMRVGPLTPGDYTAYLTRSASAAGEGMVMVLDGSDDSLAGTKRPFRVTAGETTQVQIEKPLMTRVFGAVRSGTTPVVGCVVSLGKADADELPIAIAGMGARTTNTDADGSFAFDDVEAGQYVLRYGKSTQLVKSRQEIVVPPDTAELRSDLELRTGTVRVQVIAKATGEPVVGATVEVERAAEKAPDGQPRRQRVMMMSISTDENGEGSTSMTLGGTPSKLTGADGVVEIDDVPVGDYTVNVRHDKYAAAERTGQPVVEGRVTDLGRVDLDASGTIRGKVTKADGGSVQLALVQCRAADQTEWGPPDAAPGGTFRLTGKKAGKHVLRAMSVGGGANEIGPESEVTVVAGETVTTDLRLPK